jgi:hypothetical protein
METIRSKALLSDDVMLMEVTGDNASVMITNFTVSSTISQLPSSAVTRYVVLVLYTLTFLFGISGNTLTIFVLLRHGKLKGTAANCFILNLAIADDLFVVSLPFMAYSTFVGRWHFGAALCKLMNAFRGVNLFASVFTMTLMSIDRYLAIVHPLRSLTYRTMRNALIVCVVTWVTSFVIVTPFLMYSNMTPSGTCKVFNDMQRFMK